LADRQYGVVSRRQLLAMGFGEEAIRGRLEKRNLVPLRRDVYALGHRFVGQRGFWLAAVLACGDEALLSHASAASLWGLQRPRSPIDVNSNCGRQGRLRREGIRLHRCRIDPADRTSHDRIPVTTVERTLFDFAEVASFEQLKGAAEEADRTKSLRLGELERVCERGRGRRALRPVRRLLAELSSPTEGRSPLEQRFHAFCRRHGLPEPARNVQVLDREVDALWPSARLVIELDSWEHHGHRAAFESDRARDPKLLLAGYKTVRVTHRRLDAEAEELAAEINEFLRAGRTP
jgi:very-short-patch-repair endonuclease